MANVILRGSTFYLRRRVPRRYQPMEDRKTVEISLHTDSENAAKVKAVVAWDNLIGAWEAKLRGDSENAEIQFEAARDLAQRRGFQFTPAAKVAKLPLEDVLRRVEAVPEKAGEPDRIEAAAILGGVAEPPRIAAPWNCIGPWQMIGQTGNPKIKCAAGKTPESRRRIISLP